MAKLPRQICVLVAVTALACFDGSRAQTEEIGGSARTKSDFRDLTSRPTTGHRSNNNGDDIASGAGLREIHRVQLAEQSTRLLSSPDVSDGLRKTLRDWRQVEGGIKPMPSGTIRLLMDPHFDFKQANSKPLLSPVDPARPPLRMIEREVDPDRAADALRNNPPPGGIPPLAGANLNGSSEQERQHICGEVVEALRTPVNVGAGDKQNRIDQFGETCLFVGGNGSTPPLTQKQRVAAAACADLYATYLSACLPSTLAQEQQRRIQNFLGVLILDAKPADAASPPDIICSAFLIGAREILTARHCLAPLAASADAPVLRFLPIAAREALTNSLAPAKSGSKVVSVVLPSSFAQQPVNSLAAAAGFSIDNDIAVLRLESEPFGANFPVAQAFFGGVASAWSRIAIGGFHRFAYRAMLLKARLGDKPLADHADLIVTGDWVKLIKIDGTPTCRLQQLTASERVDLGATSDRVFGHFCQTHERGSGAALLSLSDDPAQSSMVVVGVHVGGKTSAQTNSGIAIEETGSSNFGVIFSDEFVNTVQILHGN